MLKDLFKKKQSKELVKVPKVDVVLRLMFELAISDGNLDQAELKIIRERAKKFNNENEKASTIVKNIIDETEKSSSFYPSVKEINETYSYKDKIELLELLWRLVTADSKIDAYEENLYFRIAELIKIKRAIANKIKQQSS